MDEDDTGSLEWLSRMILQTSSELGDQSSHYEIARQALDKVPPGYWEAILLSFLEPMVIDVVMSHHVHTREAYLHTDACVADNDEDDEEIGPPPRTDVDSGRTGEMRPGETRRYSIPDGKGGYLREVEWLEQEGLDPTVGGSSG